MTIPSNWLTDQDYPKVLVAVLEYYTTELKTMYLSTHPLVATYNGNLVGFNPRLVGDATFSVGLVDSDKGVRTTSNYGQLNLLNSDGKLDSWLYYGVDGRPIKLYLVPYNSMDIDVDGVKVFDGTVDRIDISDNNSLAIVFKDPILLLDFPLDSTNYTVGEVINYTIASVPKTVTVTDNLKDKPKPVCYGTVYNIEPILLSSATKTYQVDYAGIEAVLDVYDRGVKLTPGIGYNVDLATGIIELVANNSGTVTCDIKGRKLSGTFSDYASDIIKDIVATKGISTTSILPNTSRVGIYIPERENTLDILDRIVSSYDGFFGFDYSGNFFIGNMTIPNTSVPSSLAQGVASKYGDLVYDNTGTYVLASDVIGTPDYSSIGTLAESCLLSKLYTDIEIIDESDIIGDITLANVNSIVYSSKVRYLKNYTVQTDIAYSVADARKEFLSKEFRETLLEDNSVKVKHLRAVETIVEESYLVSESSAKQLANRMLRKNATQMFELKAKANLSKFIDKTVGSVLHIVDYRYGLTSGINAVLREVNLKYLEGMAEFTALLTLVPNQQGTFAYYTGTIYNVPANTADHILPAVHYEGRRWLGLDNINLTAVPNHIVVSEYSNIQPTDPKVSIRKIIPGYVHLTVGSNPEVKLLASGIVWLDINISSGVLGVYHNTALIGYLSLPSTTNFMVSVTNNSPVQYELKLPTDRLYWGQLENKKGFIYT